MWDPHKGCAVAKIVYNFGRADHVDEAALRRLAKSITRFLSPEDALQAQAELAPGADTWRFVESRSYGSAYVLAALGQEFGLGSVIADLVQERKFRAPVADALLALVANRALAPTSKRGAAAWLEGHVALPDVDTSPLHQLYRAMDVLVEAAGELQRQVFEHVADLLNLEVDLLFLDTSSTYFEPEGEDAFRKRGHSKDARPIPPRSSSSWR